MKPLPLIISVVSMSLSLWIGQTWFVAVMFFFGGVVWGIEFGMTEWAREPFRKGGNQ